MLWRDMLRESFDYELYANRLWLPLILSNAEEDEQKVFKHILAAGAIWIGRIEGHSPGSMPDVPLTDEALLEIHGRWLRAIDEDDYEREISYRNTQGLALSQTFGNIARHAANHGTYHRGHLRGLFGLRGKDFPETDFIGYAFVLKDLAQTS